MARLRLQRVVIAWLAATLCGAASAAGVTVVDDDGRAITLPQPARRIASLSPHATEILFSIGAGPQVVTALASDYPEAAKALPSAGDFRGIDLEGLRARGVDLVVAWRSGNPPAQLDRLRALGIAVYVSEPTSFEQVATSIERLGVLTGHVPDSLATARAFRTRTTALSERYSTRRVIGVFYEVWDRPLMTVNGQQVVSAAMQLCGGRNVFADLPVLAPTVDIEGVIAADPELIVTTESRADGAAKLAMWRAYPSIRAVRNDQLATLSPDLLARMGPRLVDGAQELCETIERARQAGHAR